MTGTYLSRAKKTGRPQVLVVGTACVATLFSGPYKTTFTTNLLALKTNMIDVSMLHLMCRVSMHGSRLQLGCFMFSMICSCSRYLSFKQSVIQATKFKEQYKGLLCGVFLLIIFIKYAVYEFGALPWLSWLVASL